jgi:hypothetical protein
MSSDLPFLWEEGAVSGWDLQAAVLLSSALAAGSAAPPQAASSAAEHWTVFRALLQAVFGERWAVLPPGATVPRHVAAFVSTAALCRDGF